MRDVYLRGKLAYGNRISIDKASEWTGLHGLQFLHENQLAMATTEAMDAAAEHQRWDVVMFLHRHRTEGCTTRAADAAAKAGELKWLRFLLQKRSEGCSTNAMDHAATYGSIEILRYLHQYSTSGCAVKAMDSAASRGRLVVVKFLHENRSEGCTTNAMDGAARFGYIEIIRFLCDHRTEGCTLNGIKTALENNHQDIVQLLYERYPHHFGVDLLPDLLLRGAFEIYMNFQNQDPEVSRRMVDQVMYQAAKTLELRTIAFIVKELKRSDLRQHALNGASQYMGSGKDQWQKTVDVMTCPGSDHGHDLHPFLGDPRTPRWALDIVLGNVQDSVSRTWPIRALYHGDLTLLKVIRDIQTGSRYVHSHRTLDSFSFTSARVAAIQLGQVAAFKWLMVNLPLPIEPTLLSEAVYYHQFEIAEWLVDKYQLPVQSLIGQTREGRLMVKPLAFMATFWIGSSFMNPYERWCRPRKSLILHLV